MRRRLRDELLRLGADGLRHRDYAGNVRRTVGINRASVGLGDRAGGIGLLLRGQPSGMNSMSKAGIAVMMVSRPDSIDDHKLLLALMNN